MIEVDREYDKIDKERWSPLAKAFGQTRLKYLDGVQLPDALKLRQRDHLAGLRAFLRKAYNASASEEPYRDSIAVDMAAELTASVGEAESAWNAIDRDLANWVGAEGAIAMIPALTTGGAAWLPAAVAFAVAGSVTLAKAQGERRDLAKAMPAAFFMDLKRRDSK
jgi:hypothetical protein